MALTIGELTGTIDLDADGAQQGIDQTQAALAGLQRDAEGRLRDMQGRYASAGTLAGLGLADGIGDGADEAGGAMARLGPMLGVIAGGTKLLAGGALLAAGALAAVPLAVIGLGAKVLAENEQVKSAFSDMAKTAKSVVQEAAQPLVKPFVEAAGQLEGIVKKIGPQLGGLFAGVAPLVGPLVDGLGGLVSGVLPGLVSVVEAAGPVIDALSSGLGSLGQGLGGMFEGIASGAGGAAEGLSGLFGGLGQVLPALGELIGTLAEAGGPVLSAVTGALGPLVESLAGALGPAVAALGPPLAGLFTALGDGLLPVADALGPVLAAAADAFGVLIDAVSPILPVIGELVASVLPALTPLLTSVGDVIAQAAPVVMLLVQALAGALRPILAELPGLVKPLAGVLTTLAEAVFPVLAELVAALAPPLATIGGAFGKLLVALAPLLTVLGELIGGVLSALMPLLTPIIAVVGKLAAVFASGLAAVIEQVVLPIIQAIVALLKGDFGKAWELAKKAVANAGDLIAKITRKIGEWVSKGIDIALDWLKALPGKAAAALGPMAGRLKEKAVAALTRFKDAVVDRATAAVSWLKGLPGRLSSGLGNLGSLLTSKGRDVVRGLWSGISGMAGWIRDKVAGFAKSVIPGPIAKALGIASPSKVTRAQGRWIARGLVDGLTGSKSQVKSASTKLADIVRGALTGKRMAGRRNAALDRIADDTRRLTKLAAKRSAAADRLSRAKGKLDDLRKAGADTRQSVADGIVQAAGIARDMGEDKPVTAQSILDRLRGDVRAAQAFQQDIVRLKKRGLDADLIAEIAQAGVESGAATAKVVAAAGGGQIAQLNRQQALLEKAARATGTTTADALYASGIRAAEGLVAGLKREEKSIENQMLKIAKAMEKAIKKALGIRSPSRVMAGIGRYIPAGLVRGIQSGQGQVDRAMGRLVPIPAPPAVPPRQSAYGLADRGTGGPVLHVEHYHEAPSGDARKTAEELAWAATGRGMARVGR